MINTTVAEVKHMVEDAKHRMQASLSAFQTNISGIRTGTAHTGLVENIIVEFEDEQKHKFQSKVREVAAIHVTNNEIHIRPWEEEKTQKIYRKISESNLGLTPRIDSHGNQKVIIVSVPKPSEEYRKKLSQEISVAAEKAKNDIRNVRRSYNNEIAKFSNKKKEKNTKAIISEDEARKLSDELDKMRDQYIGDISNISSNKQRDVMNT